MPQAARLADPIGHSPTMNWLLAGLLAGAAVAVAGVAIVGTGGLAAVAIVGSVAAMGAGLGEVFSTMSWAPKEVCGLIAGACSSNVFTNSRPAARAHIDVTMCSKHPTPPPPIATGSSTVFINGLPAARVDDTIACGAVITSGSDNVYIGGGAVQTDTISPENLVPGWVHAALLVVGIGAAVVLAGPVVAAGALVVGTVGGLAGAWGGGKVFGEGSDGQKWSALAGSVIGGVLGARGAPAAWRLAKPTPAAAPSAADGPLTAARAEEAVSVLKNKWGTEEVEAALAAKSKDPALDILLTDSEYLSIRAYTSDLYTQINPALRAGNPGEWATVTEEAVSGMNKMSENGLGYVGTVRRDAGFTPSQLDDLFPVGGSFSDKAFVSTTSKPNGVGSFDGNTSITINGKSGVKVDALSEYAHEAEVLFKPNTPFRVVSRTVNPVTGRTEIILQELP